MNENAKSQMILLAAICGLLISFQIANGQMTMKEFINLGETQLEQKNYDGAVRTFSDCLRLYPAQNVCYYGRGNAYRYKWKLDAAIADYTRFITDRPDIARGYISRALTYKSKGNFEAAIADLEAALKIDPANADVKSYLETLKGIAKRRKGLEATEMIIAGTEMGTKYAEQHFNMGSRSLDKQEYDDAVYEFSRCIVLSPKVAGCHGMRALAYYNMEDYAPALTDINQALQLDPQNVGIYFNRALIYLKTDKKAQAVADLKKALELSPDNEQVKTSLKELGVQP